MVAKLNTAVPRRKLTQALEKKLMEHLGEGSKAAQDAKTKVKLLRESVVAATETKAVGRDEEEVAEEAAVVVEPAAPLSGQVPIALWLVNIEGLRDRETVASALLAEDFGVAHLIWIFTYGM